MEGFVSHLVSYESLSADVSKGIVCWGTFFFKRFCIGQISLQFIVHVMNVAKYKEIFVSYLVIDMNVEAHIINLLSFHDHHAHVILLFNVGLAPQSLCGISPYKYAQYFTSPSSEKVAKLTAVQ